MSSRWYRKTSMWFHSTANTQDSQPLGLEMFQVSPKLNFRENPTRSASENPTYDPTLNPWSVSMDIDSGIQNEQTANERSEGKSSRQRPREDNPNSESKAGEPGPTSVSISTGLQCTLTL